MTADQRDQVHYNSCDDIEVSLDGGVLSLVLNRPDTLNSLTTEMLRCIGTALEHASVDARVRVVRLSGAGRGFSSGAGIDEIAEAQQLVSGTQGNGLAAANRAVRSIVTSSKPVVAVVHGPVAGVGVSLAMACDVVLASEEAYFLLAFTKIGLMPDGGASALVAASVGRTRALKMALLAERLPAADAFAVGLVSALYPATELEAAAARVVATLREGPAIALSKSKQAINAATLTDLDSAFERETRGQRELLASSDFRKGAIAFQQRRAPNFIDV